MKNDKEEKKYSCPKCWAAKKLKKRWKKGATCTTSSPCPCEN